VRIWFLPLLACSSPQLAQPDLAAPDLAQPDLAPSRPLAPSLLPHSSRVLAPMKLVSLVAQNDTLGAQLLAYGDRLVKSDWWAAAAPFGLGAATHTGHTGPAITSDMTQAQMIAWVQTEIAAGAPAPDGSTLYVLYLPAGVKVVGPLPFTAYHTPFPSATSTKGDGFAVVSRSAPYGGGETQLQAMMRIASHEIIEGATDPTWKSWALEPPPSPPSMGSPFQVVQVPGPIETADLCEGSRLIEANGDSFQRFYSNQAAASGGDPCVPPSAETYFNVTGEKDWYPVAAGKTVTMTVTGWSQAPAPDWLTLARVVQATGGLASLAPSPLPLATPMGRPSSCLGEAMNDGVRGTIDFTAPAGAQSGDYAVVRIESFRDDPRTCYPYPTGDQYHFWVVGAYVP
jgi:hypothetical protein